MTGIDFLCFMGGLISFDKDKPSTETDHRVDWLGAFLVTAGLVLIVFVLGQGELAPKQWATPCALRLYLSASLLTSLSSQFRHNCFADCRGNSGRFVRIMAGIS
jgi:hypothetical protein